MAQAPSAWDARNQLDEHMSGGSLTASFAYDALGRRRSKTINSTQTRFHYDGLTPVQELDGSGTVTANLLTGVGVDEYLARTDAAGTRSHLTDILGSTTAELDSSVTTQAEYTYEPFGKTELSGTSGNLLRYTGREDDGTGLYYYRTRYYHPDLARFVSEDPIGILAGVNFYTYTNNAPTRFVDPFGLDIVVRFYCCHLPNIQGHVGIAVNDGPSRGFYPEKGSRWVSLNASVPGTVLPDSTNWNPNQMIDAIRIPTNSDQDQAVGDYLDQLAKDPGRYRLYGRNCSTTVHDALSRAGIDLRPATIRPPVIMQQIHDHLVNTAPH